MLCFISITKKLYPIFMILKRSFCRGCEKKSVVNVIFYVFQKDIFLCKLTENQRDNNIKYGDSLTK